MEHLNLLISNRNTEDKDKEREWNAHGTMILAKISSLIILAIIVKTANNPTNLVCLV